MEFQSVDEHFAWRMAIWSVENAAMTRPAIERCIKVFILALIVSAIWTVMRVLDMVGLL